MTCYRPRTAYKSVEVNPATGKHLITFNPMRALIETASFKLPCNICNGCLSDKARDLAVRLVHEAQMHEHSCLVTLTYSDQAVPASYSVDKRPLQLFLKRTRNEFGAGIKYLGCGEYSDAPRLRPHYHLVLLGPGPLFPDKYRWTNRNGFDTYRSATLERLWPEGLSELGSVTIQSAEYVARYCMKKVGGSRADDHYTRVSPIDGQVYRVEPEFMLCSRRPALGLTWLRKFRGDVFPSNFVVVDGSKKPVPRYYLSKLEEVDRVVLKRDRLRAEFRDLSKRRRRRANSTKERLAVREESHALRQARLKRSID